MSRIKEHKRKQIIDSHLELQAKNEKKKRDQQLYDCRLRKQAIERNEAKANVYKLLDKLMRTDLSKSNERAALIQKLQQWNTNYNQIGRAHV